MRFFLTFSQSNKIFLILFLTFVPSILLHSDEKEVKNKNTSAVPSVETGSCTWEKPYFFQKDAPGSETQFNPATVFLHITFDNLRHTTFTNNPFKIRYNKGFNNVNQNLLHPVDTFKATGGFHEMAAHEVFPYKGVNKKYTQWVPNYTLHLMGEGMLYRKLWEYYADLGFSFPYLMSILTIVPAQYINEIIENGNYKGPNNDPIADIYIFNPLALLFFSFEKVATFFSETIRVNFWPHQAAVDLRDGRMFNIGENYSFKTRLGSWTDLRFFSFAGNRGLFGLSVPVTKEHDFSFGVGSSVANLRTYYENNVRFVISEGKRNIETGFFLDKKEALLAELLVGFPVNYKLEFHLYPGNFEFFGFNPGFYLLASELDGYSAGITFRQVPIVPSFLFKQNTSYENLD